MISVAAALNAAHSAAHSAAHLSASEARALLAHVLRVPSTTLIAFPERELRPEEHDRFTQLVLRRRVGEPLAYLLGEAEFYGRVFRVSPAVLIPRPETELLVTLALQAVGEITKRRASEDRVRVLDLGTGSGCIAVTLALERPEVRVTAIDCSDAALDVARSNAAGLNAPVDFRRGDWLAGVAGEFELIVANPPYVAELDPHLADLRFEPALALSAGADGLAALRTIVAAARHVLARDGRLLVEHGFDQGAVVRALFEQQGYTGVSTTRDDAGLERIGSGVRAA